MINYFRLLILAPTLFAMDPLYADVDHRYTPQEKQQLESARQAYQQAVKQYGQQSNQALSAKAHLRQSRTAYHNAIRMNQRAAAHPKIR